MFSNEKYNIAGTFLSTDIAKEIKIYVQNIKLWLNSKQLFGGLPDVEIEYCFLWPFIFLKQFNSASRKKFASKWLFHFKWIGHSLN